MNKVLIDTDIILDFLFDRNPFSDDASKILSLCESKQMQGFVTAIMLSNIYYLLRKTAKHEKIMESLKMLMNILDIVTTDRKSVLNALNSEFKDFENALQDFSAESHNEIKIIITRNIKDYKSSHLSVMQPEIYLKTFK
ncbi:MAG: PIN domain-containing protein [Chitinophagaceae bacterium]|nr:MAG: PIN domain-containing protein [Chitinophagaceae bacterium]